MSLRLAVPLVLLLCCASSLTVSSVHGACSPVISSGVTPYNEGSFPAVIAPTISGWMSPIGNSVYLGCDSAGTSCFSEPHTYGPMTYTFTVTPEQSIGTWYINAAADDGVTITLDGVTIFTCGLNCQGPLGVMYEGYLGTNPGQLALPPALAATLVAGSTHTLSVTWEDDVLSYTGVDFVLSNCCPTVIGDPAFVGLLGQEYQVHGVAGQVYNIISDPDLQYNSRFVFLDHGECPVTNGRKHKGCFSHPGSFLGELGLKTRAGDRIRVVSGGARTGFDRVEMQNQTLALEETIPLAGGMGALTFNSTHTVSLTVGHWSFVFDNSDHFINQAVRVTDVRHLRSHGLLGQTWSNKRWPNALKYVQGSVDDYLIRTNDVFGDDFVFNQFN